MPVALRLQVLYLSDLFTEPAQLEWLLARLLDVQRTHPAEDELVAQYLVVGVCKAAAVLGTPVSSCSK